MMNSIFQADKAILLFLQEFVRTPFLTAVMIIFSKLGDKGAVWLLLGLVLILTKKHRNNGIYLVLDVAFCFIIANLVLKNIVMRVRPYDEIDALVPLVPKLYDWSFPSGHACASFAGAYSLTKSYGKVGAWSYLLAFLIAFSRIYVAVHYPTDVLCGALTGIFGSLVFYKYIVPKLDIFIFKSANG